MVSDDRYVFMEANARLQVEHTVTEEVTGLDLVALQLRIADGARLADLGIEQVNIPKPRGVALQARVNLETMNADATSRPSGGYISAYEPPAGPGIRVDGYGLPRYITSPHYDSLLAKLVVHAANMDQVIRKTRRALSEFRVEGVRSNIEFLMSLLTRTRFDGQTIHTRYVEEHIAELLAPGDDRIRFFSPEREIEKAGADIDLDDPLAVLNVSRAKPAPAQVQAPVVQGPPGTTPVLAPMQGMMIEIPVAIGDTVQKGQPVAVLEALKRTCHSSTRVRRRPRNSAGQR